MGQHWIRELVQPRLGEQGARGGDDPRREVQQAHVAAAAREGLLHLRARVGEGLATVFTFISARLEA